VVALRYPRLTVGTYTAYAILKFKVRSGCTAFAGAFEMKTPGAKLGGSRTDTGLFTATNAVCIVAYTRRAVA
jgi:hypothetical protein